MQPDEKNRLIANVAPNYLPALVSGASTFGILLALITSIPRASAIVNGGLEFVALYSALCLGISLRTGRLHFISLSIALIPLGLVLESTLFALPWFLACVLLLIIMLHSINANTSRYVVAFLLGWPPLLLIIPACDLVLHLNHFKITARHQYLMAFIFALGSFASNFVMAKYLNESQPTVKLPAL